MLLMRENHRLTHHLSEEVHRRTQAMDTLLAERRELLALPQEVATVLGSRERLWSALENLCYNALSFTPEGGSITLSLEIEPTQAHIQVRDTGVGIAPEQLSQIFQRGFTSRAADGGDGLGLYLVRLIAMEHGGSVQAASQLGSGSTFTITLPLA